MSSHNMLLNSFPTLLLLLSTIGVAGAASSCHQSSTTTLSGTIIAKCQRSTLVSSSDFNLTSAVIKRGALASSHNSSLHASSKKIYSSNVLDASVVASNNNVTVKALSQPMPRSTFIRPFNEVSIKTTAVLGE